MRSKTKNITFKECLNGKRKRRLLFNKKKFLLALSTFQACVQTSILASQPVFKQSEAFDKLRKATAIAEAAINHAVRVTEILNLKK